jgi:signal transduction histidine kinase
MRSRRYGQELGRLAHAARVAAVVATAMAVLYVAATVPFDIVNGRHLVAGVDANLSERLAEMAHHRAANLGAGAVPEQRDVDQAPIVTWQVGPGGDARSLSPGAPALQRGSWPPPGQARTLGAAFGTFRLRTARLPGAGLVVVGQSLDETLRVESAVERAELVVGPVFVLVVFFGALAIGLSASRPIEQARRRQVEFTADASHELRTPLTVIDAEVALALGSPRDNAAYREALERVGSEGKRLRRIVEDMLFLARFDSTPPPPGEEPVDLVTVAETCAERFQAVARARGVRLSLSKQGADAALITAPPEWVDRLCGVLVDNACRYAGNGGRVEMVVSARGNAVNLAVEDTGPGIPPEQRPFLFDRFHRGNEHSEGAGLGLAIADAVVRSTGGRWRVASSSLGGAYMGVSWHRYHPREGAVPQRRRYRAGRVPEEELAPL